MNKAETSAVTAGDAAAGDAAAGDDAAGDAAAGNDAAGDAEVRSGLGLTKAPPAIFLQTALSAPLAPASIPDSLTRTSVEMDVVRSFHTGLPRNSPFPLYTIHQSLPGARDRQLNRGRGGRTDAGSLPDAGKAYVELVVRICTMHGI